MGPALGWPGSLRKGNAETLGSRVQRAEHSVPTASYAGNVADGSAQLQGNICFLVSHQLTGEDEEDRQREGQRAKSGGRAEIS